MAGKTFVVVCALLFVQLASARVARDAPAPESSPLSELLAAAGNVIKDIQSKVYQSAGVQNQEQLNNLVVSETKSYIAKLDNLASELKKTAEDSDAVKQISSRVNEAIENLKKENPEVAKNADTLTKTTKELIDGVSKIPESEAGRKIKELGDQIVKTSVDALKDLNTKIQQTAKSA